MRERHNFILTWLERKPSITVADICKNFNVSEVTVRSDLRMLEQAGKLRRTRGGAVSTTRSVMLTYPEERISINAEAKRIVARKAAELVNDGDVIIADIGTTAFYFVHELTEKNNLMIITGDLTIANYASFNLPHSEVIMLGGRVRKGHMYSAGTLTLESMSKLYADKAFISCDGYTPDHGFTVEHDFSVAIKKAYIKNSRRSIMMLDHAKLGHTSFYHMGTPEIFDDIILDSDPDHCMRDALSELEHPPALCLVDDGQAR